MSNSYSKIYLHIIFSVAGFQDLIDKRWKDDLHKYICGIVNGKKEKVYAIGGVSDHIHLLISIKTDTMISNLVRDIKCNSSKWVNDRKYLRCKFHWKEGFGVFSLGYSQVNTVIAYINNQEQHHRKKTFKEEYVELLKEFDVDYDERYI